MRNFIVAASILGVAASVALGPMAACSNSAPQDEETIARWEGTSFFDLQAEALDGGQVDFDAWRGRPVLVVNVASKCGLTPQYEGLQALHREYADRGLVVVGFPCNQFLGQEPGSPTEIAAFCEDEYGVEFPMMAKVEVKAGDGQSPVYGFLGTRTGELPSWNFAKYLVSPDGRQVRYFGPRTAPDDEELLAAVRSLVE